MPRDLLSTLTAHTWAMDHDHLRAFIGAVGGLDLVPAPEMAGLVDDADEDTGCDPLAALISDGVASVPLHGPMMDRVPMLLRWFGIEAVDMGQTAELLRALDAREDVQRIDLHIDSPGGTVAGTLELGETVSLLPTPTRAVVGPMAASAAYWVAAQTNEIIAGPDSMVGSIGVYRIMVDSSRMAEAVGLQVHLISSGGVKGQGADGVPITSEAIAAAQRTIDAFNNLFITAVARGRGMDEDAVRALSTGEVWVGADALGHGLVDTITSQAAASAHQKKEQIMSDLIDLMAAHPDQASLVRDMHAAGSSPDEIAAAVHQAHTEARIAAKDDEIAARDLRIEELDSQLAEASGRADAHAEQLEQTRAELAQANEQLEALGALKPDHDDPGPGEVAGRRRKTMGDAERLAFINEHGHAAYHALPW